MFSALIVAACALTTAADPTRQPPVQPEPAQPEPVQSNQVQASMLDKIIDPAAKIQRLSESVEFRFLEGPVWVPRDGDKPGYLLFTDIPEDTIYRWIPPSDDAAECDPSTLAAQPFIKPSRNANGLTLDNQGRLLVCQHQRRVVRIGPIASDTEPVVLAETFENKRLNSPNDLDVHSTGAIFFTDPPYGLNSQLGKPGEKELDFHGVFRICPEGKLSVLSRDMRMPNGIALSPDEKHLYVADTGRSEVRIFTLTPSGEVQSERLFAELKTDQGRGAGGDGVRVDVEGRIYIAARGGIWVFAPSGAHLGTIAVPHTPANLCFGGDDMKTMYITAQRGLYRIPVKIPGKR